MKNYLKLFMSLAVLVMMSVTSCVEDGLRENPADEGCKEIPALSEQVKAIEMSLSDLSALEATLDNESEMENVIESVESHISALRSGMPWGEGTVATMEQQKKLAHAVGAIKASHEGNQSVEAAIKSLEASAKVWLGKNLDALYPIAAAQAETDAVIAGLNLGMQKIKVEGIASDLEAGLRKGASLEDVAALAASVEKNISESEKLSSSIAKMVSDVEDTYRLAIQSVVENPSDFKSSEVKSVNKSAAAMLKSSETNLQGLISRVEICESSLADLADRVGKLETDIQDLEGLLNMIQSVTFLSDYSEEYAVAYYTMGYEDDPTQGTGIKKRTPVETISLSYLVRPASAAAALATQSLWNNGLKVMSYYAQSLETKSVSLTGETITNVTADSQTGMITVTIENKLENNFFYKKVGAKMALSISSGKTDITSKFVEIVPKDKSGKVYLKNLTLSKDEVVIDEGEELNLSATVAPDNVYDNGLVWTSSNNDIVSVSGAGRITGKAVGTAVVTVTSKATDEWGKTMSATCSVKVNPAIKLSGPLYVEEGKTAELTLDFPSSMLIESKVWWISDETNATVSNDGVITGLAHTYNEFTYDYGTVTVYCKVNESVTLSHDMKVVVPQPKSIKLNHYDDNVSELTMKLDQSLDLGATINPVPASGQFRLMYQSTSASGLGWVNSSTGKINEYKKTLSPETVYVYIDVLNVDKHHYFAPGRSLRRTVTVRVEPYYVQTISLDDLDLEPGASVVLNPKFTSDVAGVQPTNTAVEYTSSNTSIATVDADGTLRAISAGEVTITARSKQDPSKFGTCTVRVTAPWKEFEVGQYILNNNGEIEFASDVTSSNKSKIIGVVIAKTNPRVTDTQLPSDCTHGIAVALGQASSSMKWWSTSISGVSMYQYVISANNTKGYGDPRGLCYAYGSYSATEAGKKPSGYSNTELLRELLSIHGELSSDIINAVNAYSVQRPNGTSEWYLPSVHEMTQIYQCYKNNGLDKLLANAGGTTLSNWEYWTVSETEGNDLTYAGTVNPVTGVIKSKQKTSTSSPPYLRYLIAF